MDGFSTRHVFLIEPFYAGSHKQLIDLLHDELKAHSTVDSVSLRINGSITTEDSISGSSNESTRDINVNVHLATMTGKKWHWRARTSALYFAQTIPSITLTSQGQDRDTAVIFTSSTLPLHELISLRKDLSQAYKIVYFHENQLVYPVRKQQDRDFQYGYNQVLTCLVADKILFNSHFNMSSFLSNLKSFFKLQPDYRPKNLLEQIQPKCSVLYYPINLEHINKILRSPDSDSNLVNEKTDNSDEDQVIFKIAWPHRWEFDKNPDLFFRTLSQLVVENVKNFRIYVLGEGFTDNPEVFSFENQAILQPYLAHLGYLSSKDEYIKMLQSCDIVISTAEHEFFGVAMIEAVHCGCYPIAPNKLVYPEIFPSTECLYNSESDLILKLKNILADSSDVLKGKQKKLILDMDFNNRFAWNTLKPIYVNLLTGNKYNIT